MCNKCAQCEAGMRSYNMQCLQQVSEMANKGLQKGMKIGRSKAVLSCLGDTHLCCVLTEPLWYTYTCIALGRVEICSTVCVGLCFAG